MQGDVDIKIFSGRLSAFALLFGFLHSTAYVIPVQLVLEGNTTYQQRTNSPCFIGNPSCNNPAGFNFTLIPSNTASGSLSSPDYTVQQLRDFVGDIFVMAIDLQELDSDAQGVAQALFRKRTYFMQSKIPKQQRHQRFTPIAE